MSQEGCIRGHKDVLQVARMGNATVTVVGYLCVSSVVQDFSCHNCVCILGRYTRTVNYKQSSKSYANLYIQYREDEVVNATATLQATRVHHSLQGEIAGYQTVHVQLNCRERKTKYARTWTLVCTL